MKKGRVAPNLNSHQTSLNTDFFNSISVKPSFAVATSWLWVQQDRKSGLSPKGHETGCATGVGSSRGAARSLAVWRPGSVWVG